MNDAEFIFNLTSRERKVNGCGDYHKKRRGGRQVRLPSDHYTKKEREAMNGEVHNFNLSAPTRWHEFITWPKDLQVEYIQRLEEAYHAKNEDIAGMFDVSISCYRKHKNSLGIKGKSGKGKPIDRDGWAKFIGANEFAPEILVEKCPEPTEEPAEKSPANAIIELQREAAEAEEKAKASSLGNLMNIALLLDTLKGSGAKLTIEVTL